MTTELIINGKEIDLPKQNFKFVLQVNDFFDLKTRQSSYSENIELPKTPLNLRFFEFAGTYPNNSDKPYQKLNTLYLVDGLPVVIDGFGILKNTDENYNFHFYDGNIDLYKAIEGLKLTDLPFDEFTHTKNIAGVKNTWENDLPYVYAVADYGGIPEWQNAINIDFLVPSISLEWIWNKIFEITGFQFQISEGILNNKWLTISDAYKDVSAEDAFEPIVDETKTLEFSAHTYNAHVGRYVANVIFADPTEEIQHVEQGRVFTAPETGFYDIRHTITKTYPTWWHFYFGVMPSIGLTLEPRYLAHQIPSIIPGSLREVPPNPSEENVDYEGWGADILWSNIFLNAGDKIGIVAVADTGFDVGHQVNAWAQNTLIHDPTQTQFIYKPESEVSLPDYLSDIQLKDLFQEVLIQNGLTPILKDGVYRFYTLDERLNAPVVDWSEKFSRLLNEEYVIGDYGIRNIFTYQYNQDGENHNNGTFTINNEQLPDSNEIDSKFYGAERETTYFETLSINLPVFLLWEESVKETDDGTEITYKELKNHYHWLKVEEVTGTFPMTSKGYNTTGTASVVKYAEFDELKWQNLISEHYSQIGKILSRMSMVESSV